MLALTGIRKSEDSGEHSCRRTNPEAQVLFDDLCCEINRPVWLIHPIRPGADMETWLYLPTREAKNRCNRFQDHAVVKVPNLLFSEELAILKDRGLFGVKAFQEIGKQDLHVVGVAVYGSVVSIVELLPNLFRVCTDAACEPARVVVQSDLQRRQWSDSRMCVRNRIIRCLRRQCRIHPSEIAAAMQS